MRVLVASTIDKNAKCQEDSQHVEASSEAQTDQISSEDPIGMVVHSVNSNQSVSSRSKGITIKFINQ